MEDIRLRAECHDKNLRDYQYGVVSGFVILSVQYWFWLTTNYF